MKNLKAALCMAVLIGSMGAVAQTNSTGGGGSSGSGQVQPGKDVTNQMADPQGAGSSAQGSLMQKREQGMSKQGLSKQGESAKDKTGEMKQ